LAFCTLGAAAGRRAVGIASLRLIESAAAESGEVRPSPVRELIAHHARLPLPGESTRFKANPQRLFREYRRDQSTSNGENRGELRRAPEVGAGSTFRSDYLRSSDDRSAWTAESTEGGSDPCGVGAPFRTPGLLVCLDCGYRGKTLRRHISTRHGLSPDEYRRGWGLRSNHPLRLSFILSIVRPWQGHEASVAGSPHLRPR